MSSPRSKFTTLSLISSDEVRGEHEIVPRLIQDLPENCSGPCWPRSPREIVFSRNFGKFHKTILPNWVHRRPFRRSLAGIFGNFKLLAFHCHRSHALAFSASQFVRKKNSPRMYTSMHLGGFELTKLTYTRLEDNLIRHRDDI